VQPRRLALASGAAVLALFAALWAGTRAEAPAVTVGSKNFTESIVLGELLAQAIEDEGLAVSRTFNLGGTFICDQALRAGGIDLYAEYTGTAVTAILNQPAPTSSEAALALTREGYAPAGITAGPPFGFNNTFAILVRRADAEAFGLALIDDLAKVAARFRPGFGQEFLQRADGFPALIERYGLRFAQAPRGMELSLIYQALASGQVDVIAGDATSALIDALDLVVLDDARHFFPPYDALPLVRTPALQAHPEIGRALDRLAGAIDAAAMRAMNRAVDIDHESPAVVARRFLSAAPAK
jgi:glycine betaine/choline ABC-type transport system substrate-binding protein